jgi:biopolymer transport protein TolR
MKKRSRTQKLVSEINITPLTDVILVLLIIFMLITPLILESSIKIQLPKSGASSQGSEEKDVQVTITSGGDAYMENNKYSLRADTDIFKFKLSAALKKSSRQTISISADREVKYDYVMKVIDLSKQAGFKQVVLVSESEPCKPPQCN